MQTELFDISAPAALPTDNGPKPSALEKTFLVLRLDQTIGLVLVLMVFFVISFSWGFEKGKHFVRNDQIIRESAKPEAPALPKDLTLVEDTPSLATQIETSPAAEVPQEVLLPDRAAKKTSGPAADQPVKPAGKYTIQHVIYVTRSAADREVRKLSQKGQSAFVIPSGKYLQVCVSGFQTKKEADRSLRQLRGQGVISGDSYVRPLPA